MTISALWARKGGGGGESFFSNTVVFATLHNYDWIWIVHLLLPLNLFTVQVGQDLWSFKLAWWSNVDWVISINVSWSSQDCSFPTHNSRTQPHSRFWTLNSRLHTHGLSQWRVSTLPHSPTQPHSSVHLPDLIIAQCADNQTLIDSAKCAASPIPVSYSKSFIP